MKQKHRKHLHIEGLVQGVGFRYRAEHAARLYGAGGWVRNCEDGSVEMEIEATEDVIDLVLNAIERGRYIQITNIQVQSLPLKNENNFYILD